MKGPKTGPPGGTTFDPKRVHFWIPSEIYLLCARVQNWALSILNLVPPWGLVWRPIQILSWGALLESGPTNISVTHHSNYELATSLEQGRPPPCLQKVCWFQVLKTNPLDMARCCSSSDRKISKCGNTFPVHCQILKGAKVQLFQGRKQNLYSFFFTLLIDCVLWSKRRASGGFCVETDVVQTSRAAGRWSPRRFNARSTYCELDIGLCEVDVFFYIGIAQLKKVHGWTSNGTFKEAPDSTCWKWIRLKSKVVPPGGRVWFLTFIVAYLLRLLFQIEDDLTATAAAGILNCKRPAFLRFEIQKRVPSLSYCFAPIS